MGTDTDTTSPARPASDGRCPSCGAAVRADAPWCTLCWTDLRPAPEPDPTLPAPREVPVAEAGGHPADAPDGSDAVGASRAAGVHGAATPAAESAGAAGRLGGWPCSACGEVNAVELDACASCGVGFLAGLRAEEAPLLELPGVGDITALSRAQRLGLAAGVVLVVLLLTALVGLLFG